MADSACSSMGTFIFWSVWNDSLRLRCSNRLLGISDPAPKHPGLAPEEGLLIVDGKDERKVITKLGDNGASGAENETPAAVLLLCIVVAENQQRAMSSINSRVKSVLAKPYSICFTWSFLKKNIFAGSLSQENIYKITFRNNLNRVISIFRTTTWLRVMLKVCSNTIASSVCAINIRSPSCQQLLNINKEHIGMILIIEFVSHADLAHIGNVQYGSYKRAAQSHFPSHSLMVRYSVEIFVNPLPKGIAGSANKKGVCIRLITTSNCLQVTHLMSSAFVVSLCLSFIFITM